MLKKRCGTCKEWKGLDCFCNNKCTKDKKQYECKECSREWRDEHRQDIKQYNKKYNREHKGEIDQHNKEFYRDHKDERDQYFKEWREENRKEIKEYNKNYDQEHRKQIRQYQRKHSKDRYKTDDMFRLNNLMSNAIGRLRNPSIKNGHPWKQLVPYTLIELKKHLKRTLPDGYTWEDFMQGKLHIDHILPKAIFHYEKPEDFDFQICWGLGNLRLLPAKENMSKRSRLIIPFQKCFPIKIKIKK